MLARSSANVVVLRRICLIFLPAIIDPTSSSRLLGRARRGLGTNVLSVVRLSLNNRQRPAINGHLPSISPRPVRPHRTQSTPRPIGQPHCWLTVYGAIYGASLRVGWTDGHAGRSAVDRPGSYRPTSVVLEDSFSDSFLGTICRIAA